MYVHNDTAAFMGAMFTENTHLYIQKMGHETDKEEKKRLNDIVLNNEKKIDAKVANKQKKNDKNSQEASCLASVILEFNKKAVDDLKGDKLKDQFLAFRLAGAPIHKGVHKESVVVKLKDTIKAAVDKLSYP